MKHFLTTLIAAAFPLLFTACEIHNDNPVVYDDIAPFPPVGIVTVSLDNAVELQWIGNQESDLAGYNIYVSSSYSGRYQRIGTTSGTRFTDSGARNGTTYYYAVSAFDFNGNESALSKDVIYDTPRPEGRNVTLVDRYVDVNRAGYDFSAYSILHYDTDQTDVYFERSASGTAFLVVWNDSEIQDMGYTKNIDEISSAPEAGWSPTKDAQAIVGHTYVTRTFDNHFAKVRVIGVSPTSLTFDWAYQTSKGNPELLTGDRSGMTKRASERTRHAGH